MPQVLRGRPLAALSSSFLLLFPLTYGSTTMVQVYVPGLRLGADTCACSTFPLGESPMFAFAESTQVICDLVPPTA
jgi:hypothetical protein